MDVFVPYRAPYAGCIKKAPPHHAPVGPRRPVKNAKADGALRKHAKSTEAFKTFLDNTYFAVHWKRLKSQCYKLIGGFLSADSILYFVGFVLQVKSLKSYEKYHRVNLRLKFLCFFSVLTLGRKIHKVSRPMRAYLMPD
jgi:hypothetical protein